MERRTRNAAAIFVVLVLTGLLAACEIPVGLGDEECIAFRVDTISADSLGIPTNADTFKFKRECEEDHPAVPARTPSDLGGGS